ncbi:MAG: efflux transporter periplasmic adaptor subunit [Rhizobiales bacterium NRL2]|jgi:HlyD family secretion protein|nr:MAG: efflux transporter periplasmic adaptor subunit [Rhizobiales bacterium NRL2]
MGARTRRIAIWAVLLLLLAAGIAWALRPQPVPVDLATVERGTLRVTIDEEGETRVRDVYTVYAPLRGHLLRVEAEAGDPVKADATELARIEPASPAFLDVRTGAEQEAAVEAARAARELAAAEVARAEADLAFAEGELERAQRLIRQQTISERALDEAERTYRVAEAALQTARAALNVREHELKQARSRLLTRPEIEERGQRCECLPVTAPVSGVVLRVIRRSEGVVEAGAELIEIGDPADLEVAVDLLSEDAVRIEPGQPAILSGWGGPDLAAVVRRIDPLAETRISALGIEEQRVEVVLDITNPPEDWRRLGHGFRVDVGVVLFQDEVLKAPLGALFREGGDWAVFVEGDGRAELRFVETGARNSLFAEIRGGLDAGESVVLYPSDRVRDGVRIEPR